MQLDGGMIENRVYFDNLMKLVSKEEITVRKKWSL